MEIVPGWVKAPEPDTPQFMGLSKMIDELHKAKKRWTTVADVLNAKHVPPRIGKAWHHTGVRLIAVRAMLIKAAPAIPSVPLTAPATPTEWTDGGIANKIAVQASHPSEATGDELFKTRSRSQAGKRASAQRVKRSKPAQKARLNARRSNKAGKGTSIAGCKPRKPSAKQMRRSKPVQKARRLAPRPNKVGKSASIVGRNPGETSSRIPVKRDQIRHVAKVAKALRRKGPTGQRPKN
jgi:hypothetical protein